MALLTSSWFINESIVIPDGLFLKWFYLSFCIHPLLLFPCLIILWLKLLICLLLDIFGNNICFVGSCVFGYLRSFVMFFFSFTRLKNTKVEEENVENFEVLQNCKQNQIVVSCSFFRVAPMQHELEILELHKEDSVPQVIEMKEEPSCLQNIDGDLSMNEYLSSARSSNSSTKDIDLNEYPSSSVCNCTSPPKDLVTNEYFPSVCSSNLLAVVERDVNFDEGDEKNSDPFYKKYTERMRWFDILNYDRTCGISAILNKQLGTPSSFESIKPVDFSIPYISWSKTARKRLLRSLESDFEMVYVAQSCLSWEALHHQYKKVEVLASSSSQNGVFYNNVAGEFQKFRVLLERFMEDERCEGKRLWNYVQGRFSLNSLLQVPEVTGFLEEEKEGMKGEAMNVKEVLMAIEKCVETFWEFVKTDNKKIWWKFRSSLWAYPPVEDPRDLELLADLTKRLQKKELWMKDLQGKKRCWLKRVANQFGESQGREMLFTMIDMKLVSRVLQMSMISSSQLKWCQEKLDNIEFCEGQVMRACIGPLFPSS